MQSAFDQSPPTIVLVEDEELVRVLVSRVLRAEGYRVVDVASGEEGLELLESGVEPDLLVTDLTLPGKVNGLELGRRARECRDGLKLMYMSGHSEEELVEDLMRSEAESQETATASFLGKPFSPKELVEEVNSLLNSSRT